MKRLTLIFSILFLVNQSVFAAETENKFLQAIKNIPQKIAIRTVIKEQTKFSKKYDLNGLATLYSENFESSDAFNKEVYFKLIDDTWKSYPDITYTTKINKIKIDGDKASVEVDETALATATQIDKDITVYGELNSISEGTYYLKKENDKWKFIGEKVDNEKSILKYGDTRYIKMDLSSPKLVKPNEYYTATLTVDTPSDALVIASICRDKIVYPQEKMDEVYRKMPDDNILERMFLANKNGKNEYNIASVGLTKSRENSLGKLEVYMAGVAFIMVRVNVEGVCDGK